MNKKKFRVSIAYKCVAYYDVLATSEAAAEKAAWKRQADGDDPDDYFESTEVIEDVEEREG